MKKDITAHQQTHTILPQYHLEPAIPTRSTTNTHTSSSIPPWNPKNEPFTNLEYQHEKNTIPDTDISWYLIMHHDKPTYPSITHQAVEWEVFVYGRCSLLVHVSCCCCCCCWVLKVWGFLMCLKGVQSHHITSHGLYKKLLDRACNLWCAHKNEGMNTNPSYYLKTK